MRDYRPMMASSAAEAFDDPGWAFEPKWDGIRVLVFVESGRVRLVSRNGNDVSAAYPELQVVAETVKPGSILDGEVVAFKDGSPSFEQLQSRMHVRDPARVRALAAQIPVLLMLFDLVVDGDDSLVGLPLRERRARLEHVVTTNEQIQLSPQVIGEGRALFEAARQQGLEGIVAKRLDSRYQSGKRVDTWLKVKVVHELDAVVVGWRPGSGGRSGSLGSLALALFDDQRLEYVGSVGSGFDADSLAAMQELVTHYASDAPTMSPEEVPDSGAVRWLVPELVAVIEYRDVTSAGHLRAPVFKGMRTDKAPNECGVDQLSQIR